MSRRKLVWPLVAILVLAVLGTAWALTRGNRTARLTGTLSDTLALADSAYRACGGLAGDARQGCYERILIPLVGTQGVRMAMGTLNRLSALDESVRNDGHVYAHGIGIAAGKAGGDLAVTFASCTEILQSGCYHGVIQAYFENVHNVDSQNVNAMCRSYTAPDADRWLRFQCVHGMGHGLTMFYAHNLPQALRGCDLLSDGWDQESCFGGAFMENIVNATAPHHPAAQLHMHHGSETAAAPPFKPLDPADPQYPCSIMAERYLNACYQMQTSVMLHFNNGNMADAARSCRAAPVAMRYVCHQSLGRDISSYSRGDHREAIRMCSLADPEYQPWCHIGMVKNLIDLTAKADDGIAYCRAITGEGNVLKCYEAVGEQIATLRNTAQDRTALCQHVEERYRPACLYGAKVTVERPARLPEPRAG